MTETDIQRDILAYLKLRGICAWRVNAGRASYNIRLAPKGTPDIIGYLPDGRFLGIEVKRPGKNPTPVQQEWHDRARESKCCVFVARSIEDVENNLK